MGVGVDRRDVGIADGEADRVVGFTPHVVADLEVAEQPHADQVILEDRRPKDAQNAGDQERGHDPPRRELGTRVVIEVPHHRRHRNQEATEKDDGRKNDQIAG